MHPRGAGISRVVHLRPAPCYPLHMTEKQTNPGDEREEGVAVATLAGGGHRVEISMPGDHSILADHPPKFGGADTGAQPIDLMVAALASCKAVTMKSQAEKHGWPLAGATVTARHKRVSARSLGEDSKGIIDLIDCEIEIQGDDLTDDQRERLYKLADNCWVQHAMETQSRVSSKLLG